MADYTFFFHPMSRAQIARWALHEAGADYEPVMVDWEAKPQALLDANPMGKLPTIVHHVPGADHVVTEAAAICHYLAEQTAPELLPKAVEMADYFRYLFFAAGPVEQAVTARAMGWDVPEDRQAMPGFGTYDRTVDALDTMLKGRKFVCGDRFTMADVYVGSQIDWGLAFGTLPERESFAAYRERLQGRAAYRKSKAIDEKFIEEMQK
ncbi:glutathione S-transferase [Erythrobacter sp. 3-20A1M]|uniref:glutathione S-transferase family protein n=1 Tax=Erythrobacter sp. 3-20A1M TaxID=2653850 RepID=UPI001BFC20ED|nr:glutathione S-transferase family protein [Erythrobacter sp. 3-20A1M]QWC57554.1 glutathione S-transferase [Erythrobacter sp. 3-20A1M]